MKKDRSHLYIPDTQVKPGVNTDHLEWCGNYIAEKRPDVIVMGGDFTDMASLSSYDVGRKCYEGRSYLQDIRATHEAMHRLVDPIKRCRGYKPRMVLTLGNHEMRIERAIESDRKLEGTLGLEDLAYAAFGWEVIPYIRPITIDGVTYSHYFPSGVMGRACTTARAILSKYHQSCVAGHQQGRDIAYAKRADGTSITTIIAGSFYTHDELYIPTISNNHWRGFFVLHEVRDGAFDEMAVSINYLRKKFS